MAGGVGVSDGGDTSRAVDGRKLTGEGSARNQHQRRLAGLGLAALQLLGGKNIGRHGLLAEQGLLNDAGGRLGGRVAVAGSHVGSDS